MRGAERLAGGALCLPGGGQESDPQAGQPPILSTAQSSVPGTPAPLSSQHQLCYIQGLRALSDYYRTFPSVSHWLYNHMPVPHSRCRAGEPHCPGEELRSLALRPTQTEAPPQQQLCRCTWPPTPGYLCSEMPSCPPLPWRALFGAGGHRAYKAVPVPEAMSLPSRTLGTSTPHPPLAPTPCSSLGGAPGLTQLSELLPEPQVSCSPFLPFHRP